jgi:NarL family two-component system response regulator LiaR
MMKRHVLILGLVGGVLIAMLKLVEYQFLVIEHSFEIYGALVAIIFAAFGIWLGIKLTKPREKSSSAKSTSPAQPQDPSPSTSPSSTPSASPPASSKSSSPHRSGPQQPRDRRTLFVSENTVKTHCSRAFDKLGAAAAPRPSS